MARKSSSEKEKELLNVIEKAKKELARLQEKQKIEIGTLACKYRLNELDNTILDSAFKELAQKHQVA